MSPPRIVLWHLKLSHFNEKARWGLDLKRLPHARRAAVPGVHPLAALWLARRDTLPILVVDGRAIGESSAILAELDRLAPEPRLVPEDLELRTRALALQAFFDHEVGPQLRSVAYDKLLSDREATVDALGGGLAPVQRRMVAGLLPVVLPLFRRRLDINAEATADGLRRTRAALDRVAAEAGPAGFLAGDRLSVADIAAASLLGPLVRPPGSLYARLEVPAPLRAVVAELAPHPGAEWVRAMWAEHRPPAPRRVS